MSRQQDNEELDPWTISYLPESSAICDPSPVNNDSGFELQGNFSPLEELTFSVNSSVSEPSGIGLPGNCSALEELACTDISSEPKPSDPSMTTDDSDTSMTNTILANDQIRFSFSPNSKLKCSLAVLAKSYV